MMKRILLAFCLSVLALQNLAAAPYNMDAPIESYTWGESFATVWATGNEKGEYLHKISNDAILFVQKDESALIFRFWHNKLAGISRRYPSHQLTQEAALAAYGRHRDEFTARWGKPVFERACLASPVICTEVSWIPGATTQVTLYRSTADAERPFVGYAYTSREMQPKIEEELKAFGHQFEPHYLVKKFREKPEYAEKTLKGTRIRVAARIVSLSPLTLKKKDNKILCTPRDSMAVDTLRERQLVTVSGVLTGTEEDTLLLSDVILVPDPADGQITVNRKGKPPQGFFAVETFTQELEKATNLVEKDLSIREHISAVRLDGNRALVTFMGDETDGLVFSLESLYKDQSSDTLAFNMHLAKDAPTVNGYLPLVVVCIVVKASQPDIAIDDIWDRLENIAMNKKGKRKGKVVVNGWTYRLNIMDNRNFTFSATAPKRRQ